MDTTPVRRSQRILQSSPAAPSPSTPRRTTPRRQQNRSTTPRRHDPRRSGSGGLRPAPGRPVSAVHQHFTRIPRNAKRDDVQCRYCMYQVTAIASRMHKHILEKHPERMITTEITAMSTQHRSSTISDTQRAYFRKLLMMSFVQHNILFAFVESPWLRRAVDVLAPPDSHLFPTRKTLSTTVLRDAHDDADKSMRQSIRLAKHITLMCDGTTDVVRRSLCNWAVVDERCNYHLFVLTETLPNACAEAIMRSVCDKGRSVKQLSGVRALHFTSDSAGVYTKARRLLKTNPQSPFQLIGACMAHQTNWVMKIVIETFPDISQAIDYAATAARAIRRSPLFSSLILAQINRERVAKGDKPVASFAVWKPTPTRWYSSAACVRQVLNVSSHIQAIYSAQQYRFYPPVERVGKLLSDTQALKRLRLADVILRPFSFAIALSETNDCSSGQILLVWIWLLGIVRSCPHLPGHAKLTFEAKVEARLRKYGEDHHFVSLALDPRIKGVGLTDEGKRCTYLLAKSLLKRLDVGADCSAFSRMWFDFRDQRDPFRKYLDKPSLYRCPADFWSVWRDYPELHTLGSAVTGYVPHACVTERIWRQLSATMTSNRPRLPLERLEKLMRVKVMISPSSSNTATTSSRKVRPLLDKLSTMRMDVLCDTTTELVQSVMVEDADDAVTEIENENDCCDPESEDGNVTVSLFSVQGMLNDIGDDLTSNDASDDDTDNELTVRADFSLSWFDIDAVSDVDHCLLGFFPVKEADTVSLCRCHQLPFHKRTPLEIATTSSQLRPSLCGTFGGLMPR